MSGFGAMQAMIDSLKNNRSVLKRKSKFENGPFDQDGNVKNRNRVFKFKESDPVYIENLRKELYREKRNSILRTIVITLISIIGTFLLIYLIGFILKSAL